MMALLKFSSLASMESDLDLSENSLDFTCSDLPDRDWMWVEMFDNELSYSLNLFIWCCYDKIPKAEYFVRKRGLFSSQFWKLKV
jgi:hypothetical protein